MMAEVERLEAASVRDLVGREVKAAQQLKATIRPAVVRHGTAVLALFHDGYYYTGAVDGLKEATSASAGSSLDLLT